MRNTVLMAAAAALLLSVAPASAETPIRATGLVSTHKFHTKMEKEFFEGLSEKTGIP